MRALLSIISITLIGCSAFKTDEDLRARQLSSACAAGLEQVFSEQYHPFLVTNCASCHQAGGVGKGGFADNDLTLAFTEFQLRGSTLVAERAIDPNHQAPFTGPQLEPEVSTIETLWQAALVEAASCAAGGEIENPAIQPISSANYKTAAKDMNATENNQTLTFDLGSEIAEPVDTSYAGATFSIDYRTSTTATGETNYQFSNPKLDTGDQALRIAVVEIEINGNFMTSATTYRGIDHYVSANSNRDLSLTAMVVPSAVAVDDTLTVTFGLLEAVDFNPPSFVELTTAGGVFADSCVSCHSTANPQGGLDLSERNALVTQFLVIPFAPDISEIYKRMIDEVNPMPPGGLLPEASQDQVRDWIRDGAP